VFQARIRPAFALVSDSGAAGEVRGAADLRLIGETAFQETNSITLFAPQAKRVADLLAADQLPVDWLAFDLIGRPIGRASTIGAPARVEILSRLAKSLNVQGIAAVARNPGGDQSDMLLMLFAPGSATPDVVRWRNDSPLGAREAVRLLDQVPPLFHSSIGVVAIDVQDTDGAVVVGVSPGGSAEAAAIKVGDTIVSAGSAPVTSVVQLMLSIEAHPAGKPLSLELKDLAGVSRKADVAVQAIPNVVSLADQALLSNALALQYAYRTSLLTDALEEVTVRLNLAALALRLRNGVDAIRELESVARLATDGRVPPSLTDAVNGTTQYLIGLALDAEGDVAGAERAWRVAAQSRSSLLVDNGEPIKELSEQRLKQLTALGTGRR
jgi:PDZ domain-containing protein